MLCPSSRPAALVFVLAVLDFMRHMRVTPTTNVIKLLFEFMRKLLLCSLVVGVTLRTSLPPRTTPINTKLFY